jgi:hypothetical protein
VVRVGFNEGVEMIFFDVAFSVFMAVLVGWLFDRRAVVGWFSVVMCSFVLACLALLVGGNMFHSFRALVWVVGAFVLALVLVGLKAVCAMWIARSNR